MADPAKLVCEVDGCGYGSESVVAWKLGKGVELPYTGGKVGQATGMHLKMRLCKAHRIEAIDTHPRPYKAVPTAWSGDPAKHGLTVTETGQLLVPGVAVQ